MSKALIAASTLSQVKMTVVILFCLMAGFTSECGLTSRQGPGKVIETWETTNHTFKVRVTAYDEKGSYPSPGGGYYVFQSAPVGSENWGEIMTFRHDDPIAIPRDQVRFVSDLVGYVFMGWQYAVTTDGGRSWSLWDASKDPALSKTYRYDSILGVSISPDGNGEMTFRLTGETKQGFKTKDYGQHWSTE